MSILTSRRRMAAFFIGVICGAAANIASATEGTLRVILPVGAGSGVDTIMRAAGPSLSKALNRPVVIENLPGAGGIPGTLALIKAPADGSAIGVVSNNHVVNPAVYKKMPFDTLNDITPISIVGATPLVFVVNASKINAKNAKELQALLKSKPGAFNYGSPGNGTILHLADAMFMEAAGVDVHHIPYKGTAPMVADLLGGQVDMAVVSVPAVQGHLKSGALRAIGVMGKQRVPSLSDVPTIAEQGFPDVDIAGWFAVIGPPRLPTADVKRLHDAVVAAFATAETRDAMAKQENIIAPTTPEVAGAYFRSEQERYGRLVKKANISLD